MKNLCRFKKLKDMKNIVIGILILFVPSSLIRSRPEEYDFDPAEIEKKPYHFGGYLGFRPVLFGLDRNAALYQVKYYDQEVSDPTGRNPTGSCNWRAAWKRGISRLFARVNTDLQTYLSGLVRKKRLCMRGFLSMKPSSSLILDAGKKTLKWGKGYAWNPVAFLDRPKNPDDPDLAPEGFSCPLGRLTPGASMAP